MKRNILKLVKNVVLTYINSIALQIISAVVLFTLVVTLVVSVDIKFNNRQSDRPTTIISNSKKDNNLLSYEEIGESLTMKDVDTDNKIPETESASAVEEKVIVVDKSKSKDEVVPAPKPIPDPKSEVPAIKPLTPTKPQESGKPTRPEQNYDEVTEITYRTHTGNLNYVNAASDKYYSNHMSRITINTARNELMERSCNDLSYGSVSLGEVQSMWVGKYIDNKYKVRSVRMVSTTTNVKGVEESDADYIDRIRSTYVFDYRPQSNHVYDRVIQHRDLVNRAIVTVDRIIFEFESIK